MHEIESYIACRKSRLLDQLLLCLNHQFGKEDRTFLSLGEWAEGLPVILDGKPFSFKNHEYLKIPYEDIHPDQVYAKSAQMGCTSLALLRAIHGARYLGYRGILYLFPGDRDVQDFSRARIAPLIQENPTSIGTWIRDTDAVTIKQIWNCFMYMRGMRSRVALKSVPVDFTIYDELDEAPQKSVDLAQERMSHSVFKHSLKLSNPTLPSFGIDFAFQQTDRRYWLLKCPSCDHYTCLEDTFPDCLLELPDGRVIRACQKCKGELDPSRGEWVAKAPDIKERRGYHFSQLYSHFVEPKAILHQFRTTDNLTEFYNLKIGDAYVDAENRLTLQEVLSLCSYSGMKSEDPGPCFMGVDQGKDLHTVIGKRNGAGGEIVHLGVYKQWEELDRLMNVFHVARCVVDALPETRNARAFAERHRGKIFLNFYNSHQKGAYTWNEQNLTVTSNRTESLDASHNEVLKKTLVLPRRCDEVEIFSEHLHNTAKKLQEDEETGSRRYIYVKLGPDHYRHAFNYEKIARGYGDGSYFSGIDLR